MRGAGWADEDDGLISVGEGGVKRRWCDDGGLRRLRKSD